jgi:hypothetical protein
VALDFPASPATGTIFAPAGGPTYIYNGTAWLLTSVATAEARNRVVNGNFCISQEQGNSAGTGAAYYGADQWFTTKTHNTGTMTTQRVQVVTPNGSLDRYRVTVTGADTALAAGEYLAIATNIEGSRIADLRYGTASAKQAVLRFGLKAPAGTYSIAIQNSASNRSYVANFTVTAANTDTEWAFVIPGDTTGTWLTTTGIGLSIYICFSCGTTKQASATTTGWYASNSYGNSANTNSMLTAGLVFELYDVGLYMDPLVTGIAPRWIAPDPVDELLTCQRYYYMTGGMWSGYVTASFNYYLSLQKPNMRVTPSYAGANITANLFSATVGSIEDRGEWFDEYRAASSTGDNGFYMTNYTLNARM